MSHVSSGRANGRSYRADLELHASIDAGSCCWEMRSNQPVLRLVKQQQGRWPRLLRSKVREQVLVARPDICRRSPHVHSWLTGTRAFFLLQSIFVSYDLEHYDSEEDGSWSGRRGDSSCCCAGGPVAEAVTAPQVAGLWRTPVRRTATWTRAAPVRATDTGRPPCRVQQSSGATLCLLLLKFYTAVELITFALDCCLKLLC